MTLPYVRRAPSSAAPPPDGATLLEAYAHMAHTYERRPVDYVLRGLDIVFASIALVVTAPLMAAVAIAQQLSRGSVLYRGERVGRAGVTFTMYKFRTLKPDAELRLGRHLGTELTRLTAAETTRLGHFLRASKLDELPQLFNVLRGDMSIVGPRPIRPTFFQELCETLPAYWQRLVVRPGLTGFAQLRLTRDMTWSEKLAHDFEYIADRSVQLYLSIVWQTLRLVLGRPIAAAAGKPRDWA
jgi:lipopolysaccharide/colanic/teichoic acid biosynthesis glycosyltransferase